MLYGYLIVFLGGGVGAAMRYGINRLELEANLDFPLGTMLVNITGCLIMGLLTSWFAFKGEASAQHLRLLLTTGILGGFTTFSAFSLEAALLWQRGATSQAALYVLGSVLLSLMAVFGGLAVGRGLFS